MWSGFFLLFGGMGSYCPIFLGTFCLEGWDPTVRFSWKFSVCIVLVCFILLLYDIYVIILHDME
jgi:hypothetical protein